MTPQPGKQTIEILILLNISRSKPVDTRRRFKGYKTLKRGRVSTGKANHNPTLAQIYVY